MKLRCALGLHDREIQKDGREWVCRRCNCNGWFRDRYREAARRIYKMRSGKVKDGA